MPKKKIAVILVPGIGGTHLEDPGGTLGWPLRNDLRKMSKHITASSCSQARSFLNGERFHTGPTWLGVAKKPQPRNWDVVDQDTYIEFLRYVSFGGHNLKFDP